jgi:hypothetical protein
LRQYFSRNSQNAGDTVEASDAGGNKMTQSLNPPQTITLETETSRLVFTRNPSSYGFQLEVRDGGTWRRISTVNNPLVRGQSFDLRPSHLELHGLSLVGSGTGKGRNAAGEPVEYHFETLIRSREDGWFEVETMLEIPEPLELSMDGHFEPELTLDMGDLPPYDRGDHVWFKVAIQNPSKWNDEAYANDLPALYYFDAYAKFELLMFFDMTAMRWMNRGNIARFLNYRCGFRRRYRPQPMYELGLYANGYSGTVFPAGRSSFKSYLSARTRSESPTEIQAMSELVSRCFELVPAASAWPVNATSWQDFAERAAVDLMDPQCWNSGEDFILNYVNGYSPAWQEAMAAKNATVDFKNGPCLDSAVWINSLLATSKTLFNEPRFTNLYERIQRFIERHYQHPKHQFWNHAGNTGTWQYVYILEQTWWVAQQAGNTAFREQIEAIIEDRIIPLAHKHQYVFPLAFERLSLKKLGNGDTHSVAGLYAHLMLALYATGGQARHLEEAQRALRTLHALPVNSINQEVFLNAMATQAAAQVFRLTSDAEFLEMHGYFLAQTFRQMYWYDDQTMPEYRDYSTYCMFQACTPIIYPAFFENIEPLARIASTMDVFTPSIGLLRAFNHARKNNFYMFPKCLPQNHHGSSLEYIPFENVGILEDEKTGWVGQEIYGSGQVFGAYNMWEAFAHSDDRDLMVINTDNYKFFDLAHVRKSDLHFLAYNAEARTITTRLEVPSLRGSDRVTVNGVVMPHQGSGIMLELAQDAIVRIWLERVSG